MSEAMPSATSGRFGPLFLADGEVLFRLYAPGVESVMLELHGRGRHPMRPDGSGWYEANLLCPPGTSYAFVMPDGTVVPDPGSRAQSVDVMGASLLVDPSSYSWNDEAWRGRPWHETVVYELHVGLLGGFLGVTKRLSELASYGITAVELMPVADFEGQHNWGYDGVLMFAPDRAYGSPDELKALIDVAHGLNMSVFLDVVYNHFGPSGNYLPMYAPTFFREDIHTPWGAAIDFRRPEVREFYNQNALYWLSEYHFDGLRFDAIHTIEDDGFLELLPDYLRSRLPGRHVHLILENDRNEAYLLERGFNAQWNDDVHHTIHVLLTNEREAYYEDYAKTPAEQLARALSQGFAYQGEASPHRQGAPRGTASGHLPPQSFISFLQNHDQIGNRARGERLGHLTSPEQLAAAFTLILLMPHIPMLFMGEEINSLAPFYFYADYQGELAEAVRRGRRAEFARFTAFADLADLVPDPTARATFEASRVEYVGVLNQDAATLRHSSLIRALLTLRNTVLAPRFYGARAVMAEAVAESAVFAQWRLNDGRFLCIFSNLGATDVIIDQVMCSSAEVLFQSANDAAEHAATHCLLAGSTVAYFHTGADNAARRRIR
jgi:malto-oligosyltrehalose trehalohydrolase